MNAVTESRETLETKDSGYGGENRPGNASVSYSGVVQLKDIKKELPLRVLSEEDWQHWITWGYVVIPGAIPTRNIERLVDLLWAFEEKDPKDPTTWDKPERLEHAMKELNHSGMVEVYHHQYLWDNRQEPRVYDAFVDIWDREDLWVSIDRASLNTPNVGPREFSGFIHWDVDTRMDPLPVNVQGVLSLSNTNLEVGGFQCVPELFRTLLEWRKQQPIDRDPWKPDTRQFEIVSVDMRPGDLLIFNSLLPHGIRPNRSAQGARIAQYIAMTPADQENRQLREWRVRSWKELLPPSGYAFPGDPRSWEQNNCKTAELTSLGKRLLGLEDWNGPQEKNA